MRNFHHISEVRHSSLRRGATVVEAAIVLPIFLLVLFVALDLALLVLEYNAIAEGSRKLAREASVRGQLAEPEKNSWGPESYTCTADMESVQAEIVKTICVHMPRKDVSLQLEWLDGNNEENSRVKSIVRVVHQPIFGLVGSELPMQSTSVVRIRH